MHALVDGVSTETKAPKGINFEPAHIPKFHAAVLDHARNGQTHEATGTRATLTYW
jgi:hypothetical protein